MASVRKPESFFTEDEYLALERASQERREYMIYLMAGESQAHGTICSNVTAEIVNQSKGTPCQAFSKDTKVRSGPIPKSRYSAEALYSFPDLVVVCGEPQHLDEHRDVLVNPKVIIEVLRQSNGEWVITATAKDLSASVALRLLSIGCTLRLSEVYDRLAFPNQASPEQPPEPATAH